MTQSNDEDWRAIVENFGEVPDADRIAAEVDSTPGPSQDPKPEQPDPVAAFSGVLWTGESWEDEGRYVPPPPPPLPRLSAKLRAAWVCLLAGPVVLLVCLFTGFRPPSIVVMTLLFASIGSFAYLVFRSPRTPREPWEDGAQI